MEKTTSEIPTSALMSVKDKLAQFKGPINAKTLAPILGIEVPALYLAARTGAIPSFKVSTSVRFEPRAVYKWFERQQ